MCKNNTNFSLVNYEYSFILSELRPLVEHYFRRSNTKLRVLGIKVIDRSDDIASILVLTSMKTLWSFKYSFSNPENWENHKLQSSAKTVETVELHNLRTNFIEFQGMTIAEADEACLKFFLESNTCLQREEHAKLAQQARKKAESKN